MFQILFSPYGIQLFLITSVMNPFYQIRSDRNPKYFPYLFCQKFCLVVTTLPAPFSVQRHRDKCLRSPSSDLFCIFYTDFLCKILRNISLIMIF